MKNKYTTWQKACGWPVVCEQVADQYGREEADILTHKAKEICEKYGKHYRGCKGIMKIHVESALAFGALYIPLKEKEGAEKALLMMEEAAKPASVAKNNRVGRLPAGAFMKVAGLITSVMFGEKAGFQRKWHSNTSREKRFDLLTCPYVQVLEEMGCSEVCPAICIQDDYSFSGLKNGVVFERKKTLGRGDDCCDFCFRIPE